MYILINNLWFPYRILGLFPNTYTFTKLLAEQIINEEATKSDTNNMPMVIFRPSIGKYTQTVITIILLYVKIYLLMSI